MDGTGGHQTGNRIQMLSMLVTSEWSDMASDFNYMASDLISCKTEVIWELIKRMLHEGHDVGNNLHEIS